VCSRRIKHGIGKCKIYRTGCANCDKGPSWTMLSRAAVYQVTYSEHHIISFISVDPYRIVNPYGYGKWSHQYKVYKTITIYGI
jgi:hypothetical protein